MDVAGGDGWVMWLREIRDREGVTSTQAAEAAGVTQGYYTMIELGERSPAVQVAQRLGRKLGFDWRRFYGGK